MIIGTLKIYRFLAPIMGLAMGFDVLIRSLHGRMFDEE